MDLLTGIAICIGLISGGLSFTKWMRDEEEKARSKEAGTDPETLAKKQLNLAESTSTENLNLQKEQFEYQKELNALTMQREDTSMQRQVADLKAAGLSPLMLQGGASANPLTSATAPQRDVSGINQAIGNFIGAYNDSYNRKMMRHQFNLQSMVSSAEAYTKLSELSLQKKKANLENAILSLDYNYYKNHPERNLGLQQVLLNLASRVLGQNNSTAGNGFGLLNGVLPGNQNPTLLSGNLEPSRMVSPVITKKDVQKDTKKIVQQEKSDYQNALDIVANYSGKDWQEDSLNYIYRHTNAWKDYEYLSDFRNALLNLKTEKARRNLLSKYPYIEHRTLSWD